MFFRFVDQISKGSWRSQLTLHHHFAYPLDLHNKDKNPPSLNSHSLLDLQHTSESFQGFSSSRLKSLKRHHSSSSEIEASNHTISSPVPLLYTLRPSRVSIGTKYLPHSSNKEPWAISTSKARSCLDRSTTQNQGSNHPKRLLSILSSSHIPPLTSSRVPLTTSYYIAESCHWKEIFSWTSPSGPSKT